ncbi:transcriptional regulator swi6 [Tulasnella sp. 330]|nr:transcriptional regulator swi6 [Tulasnella sp. 330]KAG8878613.1 transcriptional regulator swi6 [Tulasnella sp. 331]KAG8884615.1 transcriptional regulator swi6 [Tulasnella sp. 332]
MSNATVIAAAPPTAAPSPAVAARVYNAIYSSVQVYECMVRGIAVMRRRVDSYVNATQILKVAGIDKGRRTKILEKEILPGRHEIVQGGYGKYQGTWIPLERGREVATLYGVLPLLAPLFDHVATAPTTLVSIPQPFRPPPHALFAYPHPGAYTTYTGATPGTNNQTIPIQYPPPPGTALNVLQHGRSAGLFTPTAAFGPIPPGYQFTGLTAYPIPQPVSRQSSQGSVAGKGKNATGQSSPATLAASSSSAGPSTKPLSKRQKRPREEAIKPPSTQKSMNISKEDATPTKQAVDDEANRSNKRARLSTDDSPMGTNQDTAMQIDPALEETQVEMDVTPSQAPTFIMNSQDSTVSTEPLRPTALPLPLVAPNGIHPAPLLPLPPSRVALNELPDPPIARFSTKPRQQSRSSIDRQTPLKSSQCRAILLAIFADQEEEPSSLIGLLTSASSAGDNRIDVDLVIDDQGHTALHWAAALGRVRHVQQLIASGADIHRGNFAGETPLVRTVLSTQTHESNTFGDVLTALFPSVWTVDDKSQSVLHHIANVAGVKGRAAAARYFMESVLERVVRSGSGVEALVDLEDVHGDTALNVSARVGNRALVRMLIDVGANRVLGNKLGLRPADFGIESDTLKAPFADDYLSALRKGPSPPVQKSHDVIADLTNMIQDLSATFQTELKVKTDALDVTQAQLRDATRELANQRRQIREWTEQVQSLEGVRLRTRNVERALADEDNWDWKEGSISVKSGTSVSPLKSAAGGSGDISLSFDPDPDPPFPTLTTADLTTGDTSITSTANLASLIRLNRMKHWYERTQKMLEDRIENCKGASAEKELQCRKVVSLCTGVELDQVDAMLENLVIAMESDGQLVDLGRVAGFMQRVGHSQQ